MLRLAKIIIVIVLLSQNLKGQSNKGWYARATFPAGGNSNVIGFNILGAIFMGSPNAFSKYNPTLNTYYPMSAPSFISNSIFSGSIAGKGYVLAKIKVGEFDYTINMVEFDPVANKWTIKQKFTGNAHQNIASFVLNNKIYLVSGAIDRELINQSKQVWEYNPITDVFLRKSDIPITGWRNIGSAVGNHGYVIFSPEKFYQYDPITDEWFQKPATNSGGGRIFSYSYKGFIYYLVAGYYLKSNGYSSSGGVWTEFKREFRFNPEKEEWTLLSDRDLNVGALAIDVEAITHMEKWIETDDYLYGIKNEPIDYRLSNNYSWTPNNHLLYSNEIIPISQCINSNDNFDLQFKFTAEGNFNTENTFKLLLSDENGDFKSPTILDSISTGTSNLYVGTFTKTLRPEFWDSKKDYRLKVIASNPEVKDMFELQIKSGVKFYPSVEITTSGSKNICQGSFVTLSVPNEIGQTYQWYRNDFLINGVNKESFSISSAGNYSVKVTNSNGCIATSQKINVTVNPIPSTPTITANGPTTFCQNDSVTLTSSPGLKYLWSNGDTTQTIIVNKGGNYTCKVFNEEGCSTTSNIISVTVLQLPIATITANGPTTFCQGGSVKLIANRGKSYLWSNGEKTQEIIVSDSGKYSVTVTNDSGCVATSSPTAVTVNTVTEKATITANGPITFCPGGSVTLTASSGNSYLWSNGEKTQSILVKNAGNYSVKVINSSACTLTSDTIAISISPLPTVRISPMGPTTFCQGESVTLISSTGKSYLWSTGETTQSIKVSNSGNFSVKMTHENGCSNTSEPITVTVTKLPSATIIASGPTTFCQGESVTLTASEGSNYLWSNGATTKSIIVKDPGNYSVKISNSEGCSLTSNPINVNVNPSFSASISSNGSTTFCEGGSVTLSANSGSSYLWNNGETTQSIIVKKSGSYYVTVTNSSGCKGVSAPTIVNINPAPFSTITASGPTTFCQGGSVTLSTSLGSSYLWSNGATTQSIIVNNSGNYSVKVTNSNGCSSTSTPINVVVAQYPEANILASGPTTINQNESVTLSVNNVVGNTYQWYNGATPINLGTSNNFKATISGSYRIKVTNQFGCYSMSSPVIVKKVFILPTNNFKINLQGETCRTSNNGKIAISAVQDLSYTATLTKSGQTVKTSSFNKKTELTGLTAGNYTLCLTVAGQADYKQCFELTITEPLDLSVYSKVNPITNTIDLLMSGNDTYQITLNGENYTSYSSKMSLGLKPGINKITVNSSQLCQGIYSEEIYVNEKIQAYPNPFNSTLNIKIANQENQDLMIKVLDRYGKFVYEGKHVVENNLISLELSQLANDYYFIVIGKHSFKVIKQ